MPLQRKEFICVHLRGKHLCHNKFSVASLKARVLQSRVHTLQVLLSAKCVRKVHCLVNGKQNICNTKRMLILKSSKLSTLIAGLEMQRLNSRSVHSDFWNDI